MSNLKQSFPSAEPIYKEHTVRTWCDAATGIVTLEIWLKGGQWHGKGVLDRADAPAVIGRDGGTGTVNYDQWWKDGEQFEPSAEVRAAWLQKERDEMIVPSAVANPAPAPG